MSGEGSGWHKESRRHSEAARKGRPTHAPATGKKKIPQAQMHDLVLHRLEQLEYDLMKKWPHMTEDERNHVLISVEVLVSTFYDSANEGKRVKAEDWRDNTSKGTQRKVDNVYSYISNYWYKMSPDQRADISENLDMFSMDIEAVARGEEPTYRPTVESIRAAFRKAHRLDGEPKKPGSIFDHPRRD